MTQQRYDIALLPTDQNLFSSITAISRKYFLDVHDDYILGPEGLPHITLCQFKTADVELARRAYHGFLSNLDAKLFKVAIEKFNLRAGTLTNAGKFIAEYKIKPQEDLIDLQLKCAKVLADFNINSLTPTQTYSPHITLARLSELPDKTPSKSDLIEMENIETRLSLGLSTEPGVFIEELR
ncbi:MAG TPA: hypothetical protein DEA55_07850 [Rhodospirillaceae bacterium]|nr:hypothetical protein [Rhodospirillaceae bacterium]